VAHPEQGVAPASARFSPPPPEAKIATALINRCVSNDSHWGQTVGLLSSDIGLRTGKVALQCEQW